MSGGVDSSVTAALLSKQVSLINIMYVLVQIDYCLKYRILICRLFSCVIGTRAMSREPIMGVNGRGTGQMFSAYAGCWIYLVEWFATVLLVSSILLTLEVR